MTKNRPGIYETMKYVILAAVLAYIILLMLYMSGSRKSFQEVEAKMTAALESSDLTQMGDQALKRNFGLNSADYDGVLYYCSQSSISADEVLLIRVRSEEQAKEVTDAIEERITTRIADFEGYMPEEAKLLEDAQQSVRGKYIFYAAAPDAAEYRAVFDASL